MRSNCPLNYGVEIFCDKWSLLIIRDLMFFGKRHYNEFLSSEEHIATNLLADRLAMLEKEKIIRKGCPYRHINEDGSICKVEKVFEKGILQDKFLGFFLKGTDTKVTAVHKDFLVPLGNSKFKVDQKELRRYWRNKRRNIPDYDDWWQENNLNGGFAYNNITDDF